MKRPNPFLYLPFAFLLYIFAFFKGQRIIKTTKINKPSIIIANHTSFYDFIYSTTALFPKRLTYVAVDKMYYTQPAGFFMRMARSIPKCLFQPDLRSTKSILEIIKKKGIICIYPEGQISSYGETLDIPYQIAKLVKTADCDLYICKHHGAYFSNPPWTKKSFKGRVESHVSKLIKKEDLVALNQEDIYQIIKDGMYYNASVDNQTKKWRYNITDISNFEHVIYQCPKCQEKTMIAKKNELMCTSCHESLIFDPYGSIGNTSISDLYHLQEKHMLQHFKLNPNYTLRSNVDLESYIDNKIGVVGSGTLQLNQEGYLYQGTMFDQNVELNFDIKHVPTLPSDIGLNIQIYQDYRLYQFVIKEDKNLVMQFVIFGELLHRLSKSM